MSKILVTGASGFIGRQTLDLLVKEFNEIHAIYLSKKPDVHQPGLVWHKLDLLDQHKTKKLIREIKASHLLHLAWYAEPGKYGHSPLNIDWMIAGIELIRDFRESGGERAVCAGTCFEYDLEHGFLSESLTPRNPSLIYGLCKKNFSEIVQSYSDLSGLSSAWGHVFYLYGPFEYSQKLVASVIRSLLNGEEAKCSSGVQKKDFLHVFDVASAFVELIKSDVEGRVNIGSGEALSVRDLVLNIGSLLDRSELIKLGVLPARENDPPLILADNRRLTDEVGWNAKFSIQDGLTDTIEWWKKNMG